MWILQGSCRPWIHLVWNGLSARPSACCWETLTNGTGDWKVTFFWALLSLSLCQYHVLRLLGSWDGAAGYRMGRSSPWKHRFLTYEEWHRTALVPSWVSSALGMFKRCLGSTYVFTNGEYCCGVPGLISKLFIQSCQRAKAQVKRTTLLCRYAYYVAASAKFSTYPNIQKNKSKGIKSHFIDTISIVECLLGCEIYTSLNLSMNLSLRYVSMISICSSSHKQSGIGEKAGV